MRYLLVLLSLLVANAAQAIDCRENPDCALMGYSTQTDPNCLENGYVACPFNTEYKKCVNYKCEAWGFTQSDKSSWCAEVATCPTDKNFTLCQKPCFATDAQSLTELASSGKCKVVTMRNDITLPQNQSITLHADTIIDGGGNTLHTSGNKKVLNTFLMKDKTGMKNIKLQHTQTGTQYGFKLLTASVTHNVSLENVDIEVSSEDNDSHSWGCIIGFGDYHVRGRFTLNSSAALLPAFQENSLNFEDAQVSINHHSDLSTKAKLNFTNSTLYGEVLASYAVNGASITLKNSKANLKKGGLFWSALDVPQLILEESTVTLDLSYINSSNSQGGKSAAITLKGTTDHPSVLDMRFTHAETNGMFTNIITTNTTDMLILNGTTYRPTKAETTPLSQVESSENWKKVSQ